MVCAYEWGTELESRDESLFIFIGRPVDDHLAGNALTCKQSKHENDDKDDDDHDDYTLLSLKNMPTTPNPVAPFISLFCMKLRKYRQEKGTTDKMGW